MSDMKKKPDAMTLDLHVDLLVDGELTDQQRAALLRAAEQEPTRWRAIAMRFLARQTEKQAVRQLMGRAPMETADVGPYAFSRAVPAWRRWVTPQNIAAGLMIAMVSTAATLYVMQSRPATGPTGGVEMITARVPGDTLGLSSQEKVSIEVPVARTQTMSTELFAPVVEEAGKRSVVIQPDGANGAVVIPVNTLPNLRVY